MVIPAQSANSVFTTEESDANPFTDLPSGYSAAQGFNAADNFMPWDARQFQTRVHARDRGGIGVTDSACFHPNSNLTRSRLSHWPFHYSKHAGCGDFHCFVCGFHLCVSLIFILDYDYNPFSGFDSCDQDSVTVFLVGLMDLIHVIATWLWFS